MKTEIKSVKIYQVTCTECGHVHNLSHDEFYAIICQGCKIELHKNHEEEKTESDPDWLIERWPDCYNIRTGISACEMITTGLVKLEFLDGKHNLVKKEFERLKSQERKQMGFIFDALIKYVEFCQMS